MIRAVLRSQSPVCGSLVLERRSDIRIGELLPLLNPSLIAESYAIHSNMSLAVCNVFYRSSADNTTYSDRVLCDDFHCLLPDSGINRIGQNHSQVSML